MANYSKEAERQNKALKDLMSGKTYEKDYVQVGYEGKVDDRGGETRESELSKTMQSVRMPWFCPKCKKAMKKKLDRKFWMTKKHCFDCQIDFENKAYLKDLKQSIDEFEQSGGKKEFFNSVGVQDIELEKETWEMGGEHFDKLVKEAREHISKMEKAIEDEQKELDTA
jgi:ribosomal protein L37AE/L43A